MEGYAKVAQLMHTFDDCAIVRRFGSLNYQNLLYLQAEIIHLEDELRELAQRDAAHSSRRYHARDWWSLSNGDGIEDQEQWEKALELRGKLETYNDTLLKMTQLSKLQQPANYALDFLRLWFKRREMGNQALYGLDQRAWDKDFEADLVTLHPQSEHVGLSNWVYYSVIPWFHRSLGERFKTEIDTEAGRKLYEYSSPRIDRLLRSFTTIIASLLPIVSVVLLFVVPSDTVRLGLVVGFSAIFSLGLTATTAARPVEIFAATAAFAAVNVVFVANQPALVVCSTASTDYVTT